LSKIQTFFKRVERP